jgi:hypothetical protein
MGREKDTEGKREREIDILTKTKKGASLRH